jgi:lysophospholipase L1-like esterase
VATPPSHVATPAPSNELGLQPAASATASLPPALPNLPPPVPLGSLKAAAQEQILGRGRGLQDASGTPYPPPELPANGIVYAERANGNALGHALSVEPLSALSQFHKHLAALEQNPSSQNKVRILAYGASHTEGDFYTSYLRYYFQQRFGNGGPGFVALGKVNQWYRLLSTRVEAQGLRVYFSHNMPAGDPGQFGLLGAVSSASASAAFGRIIPTDATQQDQHASHFELSFLSGPASGDLLLQVDDEPPIAISARTDAVRNEVFTFNRPLGPHRIEVRPRGNGPVRWHGVVQEREGRGVVVDTLGINGTRATDILKWDEALWREQLQRRDPALVMLAYGTNEALDHGEPIELYRDRLTEVLLRLRRAAPNASCVLVGPGDFARKDSSGRWASRSRLPLVIETQRAVSAAMGCGFWDLAAFMGGRGSIETWWRAHPQMAAEDRTHLTARGYVRMGMGLADALLEGYDVTPGPTNIAINAASR